MNKLLRGMHVHLAGLIASAGGHRDSIVLLLWPHAFPGSHGGKPFRDEGEHADLQLRRHGLLFIRDRCRPCQAPSDGERLHQTCSPKDPMPMPHIRLNLLNKTEGVK